MSTETKEIAVDPQACSLCGMDATPGVVVAGETLCVPCARKLVAGGA